MKIQRLDHLVLTVADLDVTIRFYTQVIGMEEQTFRGGRKALRFGQAKINLHQKGAEFEPKADRPTPGSADLCFIVDDPIDAVLAKLARSGVSIIEGPVQRTGACGPITSVYVRDPDSNLIELSNYLGNSVDGGSD